MKNNFTKIVLFGLSSLLIGVFASAQNSTGLEKVIVEKYYISNQADADASIGTLPVGSVTYRIFLDMKQGYKFQAAYGVPTHNLFIKTTTSFFNNEDRGNVTPTYTKTQASKNTVMLDSWLSVGAACAGNFGILKSEDNGVANIVTDGALKNDDSKAGIPLTVEDGLLPGTPGINTMIGLDNEIGVFDATSQAGNSFSTNNGAWSCQGGSPSYDTTNKVLIAQITTDGDLSFELNIQIGTSTNGTEQFVARNPLNKETMFPGLTYNSIYDGLNEIAVKDKRNSLISVFPNPTNGNFSVNVKSESTNSNNQLSIYNLVGKVILKKNMENSSENFTDKIDLSAYPNGVYFIEVLVDGKKTVSKLIKK